MAAVRWRVPLIVVPGAGRVRCSLTSSVPVLSSLSPLESPLASADWFDDDRAAGVQCAGRVGDPVLAPLVLSQDEQRTLENCANLYVANGCDDRQFSPAVRIGGVPSDAPMPCQGDSSNIFGLILGPGLEW